MKNVFLYRVDDPNRPGNRIAGGDFVIRTVDPEVARRVQGTVQAHRTHETWGVDLPYALGVGVLLLLAHLIRNALMQRFPELPSFWIFAGIGLALCAAFTPVFRPLAKRVLRKGKKNRELAEQCNEAFAARKESLQIPEDSLPVTVYFVPARGRGKERVAGDVKYDFLAVDGFFFREEGRVCLGLTREVLAFDPACFRSLTVRQGVRFVYDRADGVAHGRVNPELLSSGQHVSRRVEEYACLSLQAGEEWAIFMPLSSAEKTAEFLELNFEKNTEE